jgi:hypothetical protein
MVDLTASRRAAMPKSEFALPGGRFPLNNPSHDRAALSGASRAENAGTITPAQKSTIDAKAHAKLGAPAAPHPRSHALAMASAAHLHRSGYISSAQHAQIKHQAGMKMAAAKASPAAAPAPAVPFGSLAPR